MSKSSEAVKIWARHDEINDLIIDAISDVKGKNIVKLDLRKLEDAPTDFFIICEGESNTQVRALAENVKFRVKSEMDLYPSIIEGQSQAKWICVDYFSTVIHIFYPETREFYGLEELWNDAARTVYEHL